MVSTSRIIAMVQTCSINSCPEYISMKQLPTRAPLAPLHAVCWTALAMLATSCGVRESTAQSGSPAVDPPATPATAYHLFVGPNGADTNPGTAAAPFRSIGRAAQVALPDTTVHVAPGS